MKERVLITGANGLVGSRYVEITEHEPLSTDRDALDVTSRENIVEFLDSNKIGAIVNFAAYTDVSKAEEERGDERGLVWALNSIAPVHLAEESNKRGIFFVHISTDMVFPGNSMHPGPYTEEQTPEGILENLTWYGYTKLKGEQGIQDYKGVSVVRIIYPVRAQFLPKLDYIRKLLYLYDTGKLYPLFSNQQMNITFIDELVEAVDLIVKHKTAGIFHVGSTNLTTPYELANFLFEHARAAKEVVVPSNIDAFTKESGSPMFRYPKYGGLDPSLTARRIGLTFSTWQETIHELINQGLQISNPLV